MGRVSLCVYTYTYTLSYAHERNLPYIYLNRINLNL